MVRAYGLCMKGEQKSGDAGLWAGQLNGLQNSGPYRVLAYFPRSSEFARGT